MSNDTDVVSKKLLYDVIHDQFSVSRKEPAQLVNLVLDKILETFVSSENLKLAKFGTFSIKERIARLGRGIKTDGEGNASALEMANDMLKYNLISQISEDLSKYHDTGIQESIKEIEVVS